MGFQVSWGKKSFSIGRAVLPNNGRSSVEVSSSIDGMLRSAGSAYSFARPEYPLEYLRLLEQMCALDSDFSRGIFNLRSIGNNGHKIVITDAKGQNIDRAVKELNEKARSWYPLGAGVDGLFSQYFRQLFIYSALSSESVLQPDLKGIEQVANFVGVLAGTNPSVIDKFDYDEAVDQYS